MGIGGSRKDQTVVLYKYAVYTDLFRESLALRRSNDNIPTAFIKWLSALAVSFLVEYHKLPSTRGIATLRACSSSP